MTERGDAPVSYGIGCGLKRAILSVTISGLMFVLAGQAFADWYDYSWAYRKPVTITGSTSDQTNYQVKVTISFVTAHMNSDFSDIRFTSSGGITLIDHWRESYTASTTADFWVEIPSVPSAGTTIYIYYGNSSATTASSLANTFIREIDGAQPVKGSWRLDDGTGTTASDSSGNGYTGTLLPVASEPTWVAGKYGEALSFDGANDYVNCGDITSLNSATAFTIEAWIKHDDNSAFNRIFAKDTNASNDILFSSYSGALYFEVGNASNPSAYWEGYSTTISSGTWFHAAVVYNGSGASNPDRAKMYINGAARLLLFSNTFPSTTANLTAVNFYLGVAAQDGVFFDGTIDELRVYNRVLTTAEISDLYNYYGYTTTNYPGRVLVRKYASPEPAPSTGSEENCPPYLGGSYDGYDSAGTSDAALGYSTATKLAFTTSPSNAVESVVFLTQPVVVVQDAYSNIVTTATNSVTLSISNNPGGGTLSGTATVAAIAGVATFSGLSINREGVGYTLQASATALTSATSSSFNIVISTGALATSVSTLQTQVTNVQTDVTSILEDTGTTLPGTLTTISGKIDTMSAKVDSILEDTGTTLPATLSTMEGKIDTIDTVVDAILVDTGTDLPTAITTAQTNVVNELAKGVKAKILNRPTTAKTGETVTIRYKTDSGLSPKIDIYDAGNTKRIDAASMSEIGSTGVYEYDLTLTSGWGNGDYTVICSEATKSSIDSMVLTVASATISDLSAIETKVDTLTTNLNTIDTNIDSVQAVVGTTSDTTASSTLYGKLSGVTSNVSAIATKWGSYTAADLVSDTSDLGNYLGTPDDASSEDTVFGKIAAINSTSGLVSTAATYAQNAYDEIRKLRTELDFNGKTDTAYNMLVGLKDILSGLRDRIDNIPSEVATPSTDKIAASINEALSALKEKAAQAGYPGIAEEAAKAGEKAKLAEGEPVDLNTLKNQLSELKALMDAIKASMTAEEEKPVVKSWFEMSK